MNRIDISVSAAKFGKLEPAIRRTARFCLRTFRKQNFRVSVFLLTDQEMRALNLKFRQADKPAGVLSFEAPGGFVSPEKELGEVYLAPEYIKKQGYSLEEFLIHGLLHLVGYNHKKKNDRIRMERREKKILDHVHHRLRHRFFKYKGSGV